MLRRMLERKRVDGALSQRPSFNIEEVLNEQPDRLNLSIYIEKYFALKFCGYQLK